MPKGQPCENGPCAPSSRAAKAKSDSTTPLMVRSAKNGAETVRRGSCCSSEKDSGYSDGSDWQQTDAEDQRSSSSQPIVTEKAEASHSSQDKGLGYRTSENPTMMSAKPDHPPVYIVKDMVLNQPPVTQKGSQLLLSNGVIFGSSPVIVFEQPGLMPASLQLRKTLPRPSSATGKKTKSTYLPILNSYPRIAPHPSKKPPDKSSNQESQILSKRMCTEPKTDETPVTRDLPEQQHHKQLKLAAQNPVLLCSTSGKYCLSSSTFTATFPGPGSVSTSSSAREPYRNITTSTHHRRFLNTVELLRQSGLLDITLHTKELLRLSSATEQDISQLRQHTELLCRAASNSSPSLNGNAGWEHLYQAMAESGSYPDLRILQKPQSPSHLNLASQPERFSTGGANRPQAAESSEVSPTCLCATFTDSRIEQDKKLEACDKIPDQVTFMCPDSSTG
ncbi:CLOCK-interacting pacemaker [Kryptolebias marmoratus]|uniref:Si:ch211-132b12.7 n=1 Tax=Kryptolebias marmoratus TaxID=37003 RepID=A0A3Q2ZP12_KRYMA|nr:CLOCK-interacting pacemaker [Kryptolebias marmoratus]XP_017275495.1 CLOCK-interacting pacemaker [Kryptolebias marmoratus]XP_024862521.1 CLOCK-interacting pacemaker [Kryptolebias marmoratus]